MRIQIITGNKDLVSCDYITISDYSSPMSPDNFEVNIVDLSYSGLWENKGHLIGALNKEKDLTSIAKMIEGSVKTKIVYVFPQDGYYFFHYSVNGYLEKIRIKDLITCLDYKKGYEDCFSIHVFHPDVVFEPTMTRISDFEYYSAFRFAHEYDTVVTKSESSNKPTTIKTENGFVFTTLDVCSSTNKVIAFIELLFKEKQLVDIPDWVREYEFGNDSLLKESIKACEKQIDELQQTINDANNKLAENNKFKSILVNNGDSLVKVVFEILEKLLDCDLSEFVDESKEDFRIEIDGIVFIGEIKGITSNVKNENISQLDVHYQSYLDDIEDETQNINAKAILIINPLRNKQLEEREPVNERQIELANRNGSLIIETITLLKMFELYTSGLLSSERCLKTLVDKTGILSMDDFEVEK